MQISKWGNSLAVRLPVKLVEELGLKEGDEVEVRRAADGALEISRVESFENWFERVRAMGPFLPAGYKFNRLDAYPINRGGTDDGT